MTTIDFTKGHGTHNDFVLVPDLDGALDLTAEQVRFLCDRRGGIGGDGAIRVVRAGKVADVSADVDPDLWFMDYRNADGSVAEMCGNGTRVFADYLRTHGLVTDETFDIATRGGLKRITTVPGGYAVDLGPWRLAREPEAQERGMDSVVQVVGIADPVPALSLDLGNPHTVVALPPELALGRIDLTTAPQVDPHPEQGTNVELVRPVGPGHIEMRVHERGVGETQSCGTGAAAAALATWWWAGRPDDQLDWVVDVPGGRLGVHISDDKVALSGPAVLVADGTVTLPA
ncbi:diaminopimelate epimerase [Luteipulveratus halotolerans]|uniref:Diaminopimelate epimerase n=1 Tax=Luteipulveratus halotolerans TaxID=1631356 RepID=A0A0L6CG73_9MICO|nr:diaminopimelate epimerase [Luteipulveratus halotolerans]KNX36821.1 diaminopimelate epimerase [Luteipulveratus halotolerans]